MYNNYVHTIAQELYNNKISQIHSIQACAINSDICYKHKCTSTLACITTSLKCNACATSNVIIITNYPLWYGLNQTYHLARQPAVFYLKYLLFIVSWLPIDQIHYIFEMSIFATPNTNPGVPCLYIRLCFKYTIWINHHRSI